MFKVNNKIVFSMKQTLLNDVKKLTVPEIWKIENCTPERVITAQPAFSS